VVAYEWSLQCGAGSFTASDPAVAIVELPTSGSLVLRLTVTDDAGRTDRADVVVTSTSATRRPGTASHDGCAPIEIDVSPITSSVLNNGTRTFIANVENATDPSVTWQVDGVVGGNAAVGTISVAGAYTAPGRVPSPPTVTVTAVSNQDPLRSASASVTITAAPAPSQAPSPAAASSGGGGAIDTLFLFVLLLAVRAARSKFSRAGRAGWAVPLTRAA
jgi:hypothetical protein